MDNESHIDIPLGTLLDILRANGFKDIGTTAILDIQKILANLDREEVKDFRKLKYYLSPVICRNKEDQENFNKLFDGYIAEIEKQAGKEEKKVDSSKRQKHLRAILIAAGVVVLAGAGIWWLKSQQSQPSPYLSLSQTNYSSHDKTEETIIGDSVGYEVYLQDTVAGKKYTVDWKLGDRPYFNTREITTVYKDEGDYAANVSVKNEKGQVILEDSITTTVLFEHTPRLSIQSADEGNRTTYGAVSSDTTARRRHYKYKWFINDSLVSRDSVFMTSYVSRKPYDIRLLVDAKGLYHDPAFDSLKASLRETPGYSLIASASSAIQSTSIFLGKNLAWMLAVLLLLPAIIAFLVFRFLKKPKQPVVEQPSQAKTPLKPEEDKTKDKQPEGPFFIEFKKQDHKISPEEQIKRLADGLRKRQLSDVYKLHLKKTINKTIRAGGFPSFEFEPQTRPVDFLAFVDKEHPDGHSVRLFEYLLDRLRSEEVHLVVYDFYKEPLYLNNQKFNHVHIPLDKVAQLFPETVLFVFTTGEYFFEPMKSSLKPWVEEKFRSWETKIIITPIPRNDWSYKEFLLQQSGFAVIPADLYQNSLLKILLDFVSLQVETTKKEKIEMPRTYSARYFNFQDYLSLAKYLDSPQLLEWVSATAVYPTVDWKVTLAVGKALELEEERRPGKKYNPLVTYENLLKISRIGWMQDGIIDDALRLEMLENISNKTEAVARTAVVELLEEIKEQFTGNAFAKEEFELYSNSNRLLLHAYDKSVSVSDETVAAVKNYFLKGYLDWPQTVYYREAKNTLMKGDSSSGTVTPAAYFDNLDHKKSLQQKEEDAEKRRREEEQRRKEKRRKLLRNVTTGLSFLVAAVIGGSLLNRAGLLQWRKIVPGSLQVVMSQNELLREIGDFTASISIDTSTFTGQKTNDSTIVFNNLPAVDKGLRATLFLDPSEGDQLFTDISIDSSYIIAVSAPFIGNYQITTRIYLSGLCSQANAPYQYRQIVINADSTINVINVPTKDILASRDICLNSITYGKNVPMNKVDAVIQAFSKRGITLQTYLYPQSDWQVSDTGMAIYYHPGPPKPVVYIQYNNREMISEVQKLQACMNQGIFNVPGLEYQANFKRNEIRYYANSTKDSIALLQACLGSVYPGRTFYPVMVRYSPLHREARAEIWVYDSVSTVPKSQIRIMISDESLRQSASVFKRELERKGCHMLSIGVWDYPSNSQIYYFDPATSADANKVLEYYRQYYPALPIRTQLIDKFTVPGKATLNTGIVVWIRKKETKSALELFAASDCPTCHKVDETLTGPSYADIARKYNYDSSDKVVRMLAERVIKGSVGVWGKVPAVPHPGLSTADAEQMVKYILSLKASSTSGSRIVDVATAEIGYKESPLGSNKTKYGEWFGLNGQSWSAIFISWVYDKAGQPLPTIEKGKSGFSSYGEALRYFRSAGYITDNPVPGDIAIFEVNAPTAQSISYSGGIFTGWTRQQGGYTLIQGNAAESGSSQGEGVYRLTRNTSTFKTYFIHFEKRQAQSK